MAFSFVETHCREGADETIAAKLSQAAEPMQYIEKLDCNIASSLTHINGNKLIDGYLIADSVTTHGPWGASC